MRTHGHREGSICWGEIGKGQWGWGVRERKHGEKCQIYVMGRKAANHTAMCVPMQQSCMFSTCTLKPKMQFLKIDIFTDNKHKDITNFTTM